MKILEKLFGFDPSVMKIHTELTAGLTTFMTMCYILALNPAILSAAGMDKGALLTATALSAAIGSLLMAVIAKMPFVQAPGVGYNTFFAYTVCVVMGFSWQEALAAVLIEGVLFVIITLLQVRESLVHSIPRNLRLAIAAGIGMFITFVGFQGTGIIVGSPSTLVSFGGFTPTSVLAVLSILLSAMLTAKKIHGGLLIAIIASTLLGIPLGVTHIQADWSVFSMPSSLEPIFCQFDFSRILSLKMIVVILLMLYVDMFDTIGTLVGVATRAGLAKSDGSIPAVNKAMTSDAIATVAGAFLGTSTVTTYVESAAGVEEGGRSGLTSFTVAVLFIIALFFSPLFLLIPSAATCGALVTVGISMMSCVKDIDIDNLTDAFPVFITIILMPLTYSISDGITLGLLSYTAIKMMSGEFKQITPTLYVLSAIFILKLVFT